MFYDNQQLKRHILLKHTISLEDRRMDLCKQCGKKFADTTHLRTHVKSVHLNIKEYRCKLCDAKFANGGNLKEHIGIKHLGYANAKEWRKPENKSVRDKISEHEAYEYIQYTDKVET